MRLADDISELANAEVMRRVLEPTADAEIPDPTVNFQECLDAMIERVERTVYTLPRAERPAYMIKRSCEFLAWSKRVQAPDLLVNRLEAWVRRCERTSVKA
jgi:hypothetical protein